MTQPDILEALRLPELYRAICRYAGLPLPPVTTADRFVVRSGDTPPALLALLMEEAFVNDEAEVVVLVAGAAPDYPHQASGQLVVRPGFDAPCPLTEALGLGLGTGGGGPMLRFAIERRDAGGRLLGVTWAAVSENEPAPAEPFRAAVVRTILTAFS